MNAHAMQALALAGLMWQGQSRYVVPTDTIQSKITAMLPWTQGPVTITGVEFLPEGNVASLIIRGTYENKLKMAFDCDFELFSTGTFDYQRQSGKLFCVSDTFEVRQIKPRGRDVPSAVLQLAGERLLPFASRMVRDRVAPGIAGSKVVKTIGRWTPGALKRGSAAVGGRIDRSVATVKESMASLLRGGVNFFLSDHPVFVAPEEVQGVPVRSVIERVAVENGFLTVHLASNEPVGNVWRKDMIGLAVGVLAVAGGLAWWFLG